MTLSETSLWAFKAKVLASPSERSSPVGPPSQHKGWSLLDCRSVAQKLAHVAQRSLRRERQWRIVHACAVGLFCVVDDLAGTTLYFEIVIILMFVVPYRLFTISVLAYPMMACVIKTAIVAGWQRRQWFQLFPWVRSTRLRPSEHCLVGTAHGQLLCKRADAAELLLTKITGAVHVDSHAPASAGAVGVAARGMVAPVARLPCCSQ